MASCAIADETKPKTVGMGQIAIAKDPAHLTAILGSCIGVALYHRGLQLGALAHVVLPKSNSGTSPPGKFADTAVPHMLRLFELRGAKASELTAKLVGGACMFGKGGPVHIGEANAQAVSEALRAADVPIAAKDVGGTTGRRVSLDCSTGKIVVQVVGTPPQKL